MNKKSAEVLEEKVTKLPPWAREVFSNFVQELYERESHMTMGFLEASRQELKGELTTIRTEQEQLRGNSLPSLSARDRQYEDHRTASLARRGVSSEKLQRYLQRKLAEKAPRSESRASTASSMSTMSEASLHFGSRPSTSRSRPVSRVEVAPAPPSMTTPAPLSETRIKEKTQELLAEAGEVESRNETERDRQWDKVRRAKERRKQRQQAQAELAAQMMDLARQVAAAQSQEKEKQEQKIKDRLEEMKKKKEEPEEMA